MKVKMSLLLGFVILGTFIGFAQDYDDIYYNSSKNKKKQTEVKVENTHSQDVVVYENRDVTDVDFQPVTRDVDEYNRRYVSNEVLADTSQTDSIVNFEYTDRIRRFYNPSVVAESNDPEVAELYYATTTPNVNIIIGTPTTYWDPFWYDWYSPSYYWHTRWCGPGWYSPYHSWNYHWDWHYSWHSPYYPWWSGGYGPGYYPGYAPPIHKPIINHNVTHNMGGRRPVMPNSSGMNQNVGRRPVTNSVNRANTTVNNNRRPAVNSSNSSGRRPATVHQNSNSTTNKNSNYNSNTTRQGSSNSNWNRSSSSNSTYRSSGYSSGGSRGSFGGGTSGGGHSGNGGRRR